jgi:hypothetical protein
MTPPPKLLLGGPASFDFMLDQPMTVERLLAHSIIFDEAARLHQSQRVAGKFRRLADDCVQAALVMISEVELDA